jgi:hypothetical protein
LHSASARFAGEDYVAAGYAFQRRRGVKNLDTVQISKTDFIRLALTLRGTEAFDDNTISAPELPAVLPLPYFKIEYDFENSDDAPPYFAVYEQPLEDEEVRFAVYTTAEKPAVNLPLFAIGVFATLDGVKSTRYVCSPQFEEVSKLKYGAEFADKFDDHCEWHAQQFCVFGHLYSTIQHLLLIRPELLVRRVERGAAPLPNDKKYKHPPKRKIESVRTISVNYEELAKVESERPPREYSCLAWGVIGHWRNYKIGKRVWVAPHAKGKERGNPENRRWTLHIPPSAHSSFFLPISELASACISQPILRLLRAAMEAQGCSHAIPPVHLFLSSFHISCL